MLLLLPSTDECRGFAEEADGAGAGAGTWSSAPWRASSPQSLSPGVCHLSAGREWRGDSDHSGNAQPSLSLKKGSQHPPGCFCLPNLPSQNPLFPLETLRLYAHTRARDDQLTDVFYSILKIELVVKILKLGKNKLWYMHTMDDQAAVKRNRNDLHELIIEGFPGEVVKWKKARNQKVHTECVRRDKRKHTYMH